MRAITALALVGLLASCNKTEDTVDTEAGPPDWRIGEVVDTEGRAVLAKTPGTWGEDLWILRLEGTHYEMGYQHGRLVGPMLADLWWTYMGALGAEMGVDDAEAVDELLGNLLDSAWVWYGPNTPPEFHEELQGMADGMAAAGVEYGEGDEDLVLIPQRLITLIDLAMSSQLDPNDLGGVAGFLQTGYSDALAERYGVARQPVRPDLEDTLRALQALGATGNLLGPNLNCSFYAAWGDRTADGGMIATRNMDFTSDSGLSKYAMVTVFVPDDGVPYASISWLGVTTGILAGISAEGLTVSAVGASSPYERIATEPAVFRAREALENATTLDEALPYLYNEVGDDITRAPTIGYNALLTWGDPHNSGADAQAVILESNGLSTGVYHHHNDCSVTAELLRYDAAGTPTHLTPETDPDLVNAEADAKEIDDQAQVRLFQHDGTDFVLDGDGHYIEDPSGQPIQTGYVNACSLYRGDEALQYGVRQHQKACNGPVNGGDRLMIDGGSYKYRYTPMRLMTEAYAAGSSFTWEDELIIPDSGGTQVPIGLDEGEAISRVAAMSSNVYAVVYDATNMKIRVSYESGTGDDWVSAAEQPAFLELDLDDLFLLDE